MADISKGRSRKTGLYLVFSLCEHSIGSFFVGKHATRLLNTHKIRRQLSCVPFSNLLDELEDVGFDGYLNAPPLPAGLISISSAHAKT
jgi:hypothetical protein